MTDYQDFLAQKIDLSHNHGLDIDKNAIHPLLFPHQRDIVQWAVRGGSRAIFASFGLGKTYMQLEIVRQIHAGTGEKCLIIAPLGVRQEFLRDGAKLGVELRFIRRDDEIISDHSFYITNYESVRDGKLDPNRFGCVSLDEASCLRSYGSKTYQEFLTLFKTVIYRYVCTATPSPNRFKELIHYAGFLGIMDTGQSLTRFFQRDSTKANNLTLYPHKEKEFWLWVSSWALFIQKPSDLGYSDTGYILPPLRIHYHEVETEADYEKIDDYGQVQLFRDAALGLKDAAKEKRDSLNLRIQAMLDILGQHPDDNVILWHDLEVERHAIKKALPQSIEVYGSLDLDLREQRIIDFSDGQFQYLVTKPVLSGSGCNFQRHCRRIIFLGIGYKFNDFIQSVHRIYRFLQTEECHIHIIHADTEREILKTLLEKWRNHNKLVENMQEIIQKYGLSHSEMEAHLRRAMGVERIEIQGDRYTVANNDCVEECALIESGSIDLIHTSIPFSNHYEYTPSYNDFGHTDNNDHFWRQMDYLTPELLRILKPGRVYACHVKDRILFGNVTNMGMPTVSPFHAEAIFHAQKHGFAYMGMITVVTDVVRENNQTYRLGWSEQCKDGSKMGVGSPEYILLFRKLPTDNSRAYADEPVSKSKQDYTRARWQIDAHAFWRSSGERLLTAEEMAQLGPDKLAKIFTEQSLKQIYNYEAHVKIGEELELRGALPSTFMSIAPGSHDPMVWHDINRMRTLNGNQKQRNLQAHVCLARDSLVLTMQGYKPIQDVQVGDMVLTHKGRWRPVQVVANTGIRHIINLRAQGVPGLTLTPDHKLWTRKVPTDAWSVAHSRQAAKKTDPEWLESALTLGSYINQKTPPIQDIDISSTELWLIGRWIADGHVETRGGYVVSIGDTKLNEFKRMAGNHVGGECKRTATQIRLIELSQTAKEILSACGSRAENKEIPPALLSLPPNKGHEVLMGYLSGDGHFLQERNRWTASTVSKKLALGLSLLAQQSCSAVASVYPGRYPGQTVQDWIFCFDIPDQERKNRLPFILDDGAWKKVRSIEDDGEIETWCLRVEEDESFTAEGCIVKNCPLQMDIVDRIITRYSNPGETVFDPFGGLMTVPYRALKLGRKARAAELNTQYFFDGVEYLKMMEQTLNAPTLFDLIEEAS